MTERKTMIKARQPLSVTCQCHLLVVPRSSAYTRPQDVSAAEIVLMRQLDELYLKWSFYGSRRLCVELQQQGYRVNRKPIQRLMRKMGLRAIYPKPRTSQLGKGHKIYPYLLRDLRIERSNQVWASDICYIPMAKGFMNLTGIMDWYSRRVLAWRVSNTLDTEAFVAALQEALRCYGTSEIFNTD
jgi:putative transposase